jgi:uncharacterized protein (TIGR02391 family)
VRATYESRNFTGAILDAIYVITEVLREKSDAESDGAALVGHALGGSTPRVKITALRSESDWNEQKGMEHMLRGVYQGIRNPRSHGKRGDTQEDADAILLFLDFTLKRLGEAQTLFSKPAYLERVFDPHFLENERYASLLVDEIPAKYLLELFHDVYRRREEAKGRALHHFFQALLHRMPDEDRTAVWDTISIDMRTASEYASIRSVVQMLKPDQWPYLAEVARLRIENRFVEEMRAGTYHAASKSCRAGALGTWATSLVPYFTLKKEVAFVLIRSLEEGGRDRQDYVFEYFFSTLLNLVGKNSTSLRRTIIKGLTNGDKRFHDATTDPFADGPDEAWGPAVVAAYNAFEERPLEAAFGADNDDDLPF